MICFCAAAPQYIPLPCHLDGSVQPVTKSIQYSPEIVTLVFSKNYKSLVSRLFTEMRTLLYGFQYRLRHPGVDKDIGGRYAIKQHRGAETYIRRQIQRLQWMRRILIVIVVIMP